MNSDSLIMQPMASITSPPTSAAAIGAIPPAYADQATAAPAQPQAATSSNDVKRMSRSSQALRCVPQGGRIQ